MQLPFIGKIKRPKLWIGGSLAAIVLTGASATGIMLSRNPSFKLTEIENLLVRAEAETITIRIKASGNVQPIQRVNLSPKTPGRLAQLFVEQGDRVREGQVVARMESNTLEAQLQQAEARLDRAKANLAQLRNGNRPEEIAQAEARLDRTQANLAQLRNGSRPEEIEKAEAQVEQARSRQAEAEAKLAQLRTGSRWEDIAEAEAGLSRTLAQLEEARSRLSLAQTQLERNRSLEAAGAYARENVDRAADEERRARASVEQSAAAVEEARRRLQRLENGSRTEEVAQGEAGVAAAAAQVADAESQLALLRNGTRSEEITKAEADVSEAQSQVDLLRNGTRSEEILKGEADVRDAEEQVSFYQKQVDDTLIRAPFSGIITQRFADPGAFVTPETSASDAASATSASIVALAKGLEVLAKVPEADIGQIEPGQKVEVIADSYPDETFLGQVKLIAPEAIREREVTLFRVRTSIETGTDKLLSGMNVDLNFLGEQLSDVLVLPTVAIVTNLGNTGVVVPDEQNKPVFKPVTVGSQVGNKIQILEGLKRGDRVFLELPEGQKLEDIIKPKEKEVK
jgi:HlyD family secretion protein